MSENLINWGELGQVLKEEFNCFPQPDISGIASSEAILLKDIKQLNDLMTTLKESHNFAVLNLINAVEYKEAFQIIYQIQKMPPEYKVLIIKVNISKENPEINSISDIWSGADWYERELWDLQGIKFTNHKNLKRILNPDAWEGFPMLKNYIPPLDALNGPITALKGPSIMALSQSTRAEVDEINIK